MDGFFVEGVFYRSARKMCDTLNFDYKVVKERMKLNMRVFYYKGVQIQRAKDSEDDIADDEEPVKPAVVEAKPVPPPRRTRPPLMKTPETVGVATIWSDRR